MPEPNHNASKKIHAQIEALRAERDKVLKPYEVELSRLRTLYYELYDKETLDAVENGFYRTDKDLILGLVEDLAQGYATCEIDCLNRSFNSTRYLCAFCPFMDPGDGNYTWPGCTMTRNKEKFRACMAIAKNVPENLVKQYIATYKAKGGWFNEA